MYWYLCAVTVLFYVSILSLNVFLSSIIIEEWLPKTNDLLVNQEVAAKLMSVMFFVSIVFFPIVGYTSDYYGYRITFLKIAGILAIISYVAFLHMYPTIPLVILGLSYAFFGSIVWPCAAYLV